MVRPTCSPARSACPTTRCVAADRLAKGIDADDIRRIGLGRVNGRFFCFHTGIGYDAAVVNAVERHASLKRWLGHPLFISAAISTWARGYDRHTPHFRLSTDGDRQIDDGYFSIVLNTNPYTYLGNRPLDLSPAATLDNPFVVVTFRTMRVLPILRGLGSALRGGGVRQSEHVVEWRDVEHMVVEHEQPFPYQLDGDYLGDVEPARVRLRARSGAARVPGCGPDRRRHLEGDVGDVGADPVDAPRHQLAHPVGVVARPCVDRQTGGVGGADAGRVEARHLRVDGVMTSGHRARRPMRRCSRRSTTQCVATAPRSGTSATVSNRNDEISQRRVPPRRASAAQTRWATHSEASKSGSVGIVLDLDVDEHAGAGVEGVAERGNLVVQLGERSTWRSGRPSPSRASWWTTSWSSAVRRTSSSTPSDPSAAAAANAANRVLGLGPGGTAVSDDQRHLRMLPDTACQPPHASYRTQGQACHPSSSAGPISEKQILTRCPSNLLANPSGHP